MLMPFRLSELKVECKAEKGSRPAGGANGSVRHDDRVVYCGDYQIDSCILHGNYWGQFFGQSVLFQQRLRRGGGCRDGAGCRTIGASLDVGPCISKHVIRQDRKGWLRCTSV